MSKFQKRWLTDYPERARWLAPDPSDEQNARCKLCLKTFSLSNMGLTAVRSHETSKAHKRAVDELPLQRTVSSFFAAVPASSSADAELQGTSNESSRGFVISSASARAEIIWACKCIVSHYSYHSSVGISNLFRSMFPDSDIAAQFSMGSDKTAYVVTYGLAPFFKHQLSKLAAAAPKFTVCFDESLNKIAQKCQMDIMLRFWDSEGSRLVTRYLASVFLGHSRAVDTKGGFTSALEQAGLNTKRKIHVSMDGPNVNWSFLQKLKEDLVDSDSDPGLLKLGSCGLHVVNGAFQTGHRESKWNINSFLRSLYYMFKDSPSRRADFIRITGTTQFTKKLCSVRWTENSGAVSRAIELLDSFRKYVSEVKPVPTVQSFQHIRQSLIDPLLPAKLEFFRSVSLVVEPFLVKLQTDKPMVPFLYRVLQGMITVLMKRLIKPAVLNAADSASKLLKIDVSPGGDSCTTLRGIDVGFGAEKALRAPQITDLQRLSFREGCRSFLSSMTAKIIERSPLKFRIIRATSCLSPKLIMHSRSLATSRLQSLLEIFVQLNIVDGTTADKAKNQYFSFCDDIRCQSALKEFREDHDDLGALYGTTLLSDEQYDSLWVIVRKVLVLSHGNASVERGFSINGDLLVDNLKEESLIAQRVVYDNVKDAGGPDKLAISADLLQYVRSSRSRYRDSLNAKKENQSSERRAQVDRKRAAQEIKQLEAKKQQLSVQSAKEISSIQMKIGELQELAKQ